MATKDFKIRHSLTVSENATIEGNLTLGGNTVSRLIDSDEVQTIINNSSSGFDSDQVVAIISENPGSQAINTTVYTFTSPANDSEFTGTDDNGLTLAYTPDKVYVYLNGILLVNTTDYIATNGTSIILVEAPDSENVLQIVKHEGTVQAGFDSDQVVAIINENVVSGSVDSDVAAIAQLRRDADSDSIRIQALGTSISALDTALTARLDSDEIKIQAIQTQLDALNTGEITALRADADSDSIAIQAIRTSVDSDYSLFNTKIALFNGLTDSDLTTVSNLRNDVDSDSIAIQAVRNDMDVSFSIVNNGASAYTFSGDGFPSGVDNPTLYLNRGHTYNFRVNASGHPFEIRLSNGGSAYSSGVTNNAAQIGEVKFVVPMDAPETLVYQCTAHSGMVGTIKIGKQGFDSDQIASMILENSSGSGMTDSDLAVVAKLRADVDSDSIKLQALEETVAGLSVSAGFDSDQVVAIINENPTSSGTGMTDSDLKVVADLRNDITALQIGGIVSQESKFTTFKYKATQGQTTFSGLDRDNQTLAYTVGNINVYINGILLNDSDDYTATNGTSVVLDLAADSDDVVVIQKMRSAFDSDTILNIWNNNQSNLTISRYDYIATQSQTVFSGADNNGNSLSYIKDKIQVFLNGILLINTNDYTATNGTSLTLTVAADSDDTLSIIKYLGADAQASDNLTVTRFTYKYGEDGNSVVGDSEITGGDENGNTLSYVAGKIQVYSNGILLEDSDDYVATDGSTITLRAAPDSDDVVSIFKYLGSENLGFDSEQVVSILNENKIIDYKTYSYDGTLSLNTGTKRLYISIACTLSTVDVYLATASVGADVILNIKKNGSSLNTLTITDGNSISENNSFNVSFIKGDYITLDITQIGSSTAGEDLYANFNFV